jgi:quercetin dioxygenase-like cupin family protein
MNRVKFVTLAWAVVSLAGVTAAIATPPSGTINRNELAVGKVTDPIDIQRSEPTDFHIDVVTIDPGGNSGWHTHPGPEYSVVKAGEVILQRAPDCDPITLKAGQGFFTPGGTAHVAHNDGKEAAEIYVTYTVPAGTTVLRQDSDDQCAAAKTAPPKDAKPPKEK